MPLWWSMGINVEVDAPDLDAAYDGITEALTAVGIDLDRGAFTMPSTPSAQ